MKGIFLLATLFCFQVIAGCTAIPPAERDDVRAELATNADVLIERLMELHPQVDGELKEAEGYFTARANGANVMIAGAATGLGRLVDQSNQRITFLDVMRLDLGPGIGAGSYSVLIIFQDREVLEKFQGGQYISALGAESGLGKTSSSAVTGSISKGVKVYVVEESGAAVAVTGRVTRVSVNEDLTDTGISEVSIPSTRAEDAGRQKEGAPRQWDRALPFLAQQVIDEGYDLPLPYGLGLTYANIDQDQKLTDLDVGLNGASKEPYEFVSFENAVSRSDTLSLKVDAWVLPFMNVFAMIGRVEGEADLDVLLDGNGMLDKLEEDCSRPVGSPLCRLLEDRTINLPIETNFDGTTYGLGMTLAGGWQDIFVAIPFNATYADMDRTHTEGLALTVTPRVGYMFHTDNAGTIALFVGANYLKTQLDVSGTVTAPGHDLVIDYTVSQDNADRWNSLVGFNWDISRNWSINAEYNGFSGSRDAVIASLGWRY